MELRKLIQHGNSSLTISLPSKWIKNKGLKKGDQIQIIEKGETLILIHYLIKIVMKLQSIFVDWIEVQH